MMAKETITKFSDAQFLIGSSYEYSLEKALLKLSAKFNINLTYYLDHYSNLEKRFNVSAFKQVLPKKIIVIDKGLCNEIKSIYNNPSIKFLTIRHPRFIENDILMANYTPRNFNNNNKILFISEKIKGDTLYYKNLSFDEFKVYEDVKEIADRNGFKLYVKLHPLERVDKYIDLHPDFTIIKKDIREIVEKFHSVIGINSILLNEILEYRTGVFFYQPDVGRHSALKNKYPSLVYSQKAELEKAILDSEVTVPIKKEYFDGISYQDLKDFLKC
jgi:hypothetical protein